MGVPRHIKESLVRRAAVAHYLKENGPSTTAQLARVLKLKPAALNQWLFANRKRYMLWERMPNYRWLPLDEEPSDEETVE